MLDVTRVQARAVIVATVLLAASLPAGGQQPAGFAHADAIDAYVRTTLTAREIPGAAIAVLRDGEVVFQRAYGMANLETQTPVTLTSVFELTSVTKQFTAAAILVLAQDGKLRLDMPLAHFVRDTPPEWQAITIRQLLTHTAGLPVDAIVGHDGSALLNIRTRHVIEMLRSRTLAGVPGHQFLYSDAGYFLLGMVIESASGQPYSAFLQSRLFDPAGMRSTSVLDRARILRERVDVYTRRDGTLANWRRDWQYELPSFFGVFSTVQDLGRWDTALRQHRILSRTSLEEMWTPARLANGEPVKPAYGFGWYLPAPPGHRVAEHPGASGTFLLHVIDTPLTVIALTNLDGATGPSGAVLAHGIASIIDPTLVFPRK